MTRRLAGLGGLALVAAVLTPCLAVAQAADRFYDGKQIEILVGTGPGGGYDQYARLVAQHLGRHIPGNPAFVVKHMPGGGGRQALNHIYNIAPKDGTVMGTLPRNVPFDRLYGEESVRADSERLTWLASLNSETSLCVAWADGGFKALDDVRAKEIAMGSNGPTITDTLLPKLLNEVAGTKMKVVLGYKSSTDVHLAMERGEVQGRCGIGWDSILARYPHWLAEKKISLLAQFALKKHPDLPNVPFIMDLAKTEEHRQLAALIVAPLDMGRPYFMPPGVPPERADTLRRAFEALSRDPDFLADAKKQQVEITLMRGDDVAALVKRLHATPKPVLDKAKPILLGTDGK
jgi:tripartite-type tricarboxylate transporter receptor subunit TctC